MGPGYLIAVGYLDPGNWATDLAAGSGFGYSLLWVIMLSNLMAIMLQVLAIRLGVATGMDLAQACRANSSRPSALLQWIACEIAICACDLAEVIGSAIALNLPFAIVPLIRYTSSRSQMGTFVNPRWMTVTASLIALLIIALNLTMLFKLARSLLEG